jgi:hypothetical protein
MNTDKTNDAQLTDSGNSARERLSRREFVERLRRTAILVAPMVAAVTLMTPKAHGYG